MKAGKDEPRIQSKKMYKIYKALLNAEDVTTMNLSLQR